MGYFQYMVDDFEARMQTYRQQIEQLESYLAASTAVHAAPLSPQALAALIQQIQDSFMEIAGTVWLRLLVAALSWFKALNLI